MDVYGCTRTKYDIPLNHLDYGYITSCSNKQELEKIIKILRSGKEGSYPDLEKCAEQRLASLDPTHKILRKPDTLKTSRDIDKEEWKQIDDDLQSWMEDVKVVDKKMSNVEESVETVLPPVRGSLTNIPVNKTSSLSTDAKNIKRVKPREYREWDKFDIDAELSNVDKNDDDKSKSVIEKKQSSKPIIDEAIDSSGVHDEVKQIKAEREKSKGNEAFKAGDFEEALVYYSRSLALYETVAAHNNRAQAYLKLKKWNQALDDCEFVLKVEPTNLKAILRRAVANQGLTRYSQAKQDLNAVLTQEPNNRQALEVLRTVNKALTNQNSTTGRSMIIEEIEGSDTDDNDAELNRRNIEISANVSDNIIDKTDDMDCAMHNSNIEKCVTSSEANDISGDCDSAKQLKDDVELKFSCPQLVSGDNKQHVPVITDSLPPAIQSLKDEGNDLFRKGQYADAIDKYSAAIQLLTNIGHDCVNLSTLLSNRAACLMKVGDCHGCVIDCDSALALCPGATKALLRRAMAYEALEKYRQAYIDFRQVLTIDVSSDIAQQGSDRCSNMLQRLDGTQWRDKLPTVLSSSNLAALASNSQTMESQLEINEKTFEICKTQGNTLFSKGDYVTAIELFTKCLQLFPDRVVPYTNRALCYLRLNKFDDVLSDCNQALSLEFHNVKALFRRAQAYKMLERYEESMIDLETLLKIDSSNTAAKKELQTLMKSKDEAREKRLEASIRKHHRPRVPTEDIETSSVEMMSKVTKKESSNESVCRHSDKSMTAPQLSKISAFEFTQAWTSLKGTTDIEPYVKIIDQIQPSDLRKVVTNKLDSDFLFTVIRCVGRIVDRGDAQRGYQLLVSLSTLPRFDTIIMFLSDSEKKEVSVVFDQLASSCALAVDKTQLAVLRHKYG